MNTILSDVNTSAIPQSRPIFVRLLLGVVILALWFVLCRHLSAEWTYNEQYSYGWFVPFFALYLFWLRWEDRPRPEIGGQKSEVKGRKSDIRQQQSAIVFFIAAIALIILLPLRLVEIGNPDWRPLGWIHAAAVATFTFVILWSIGGSAWVRHFAFPILFFFVSVPWISPIENPIIQGLMHVIAGTTAETANLLGIPAQLKGNVIHIRNGIVGVNEACSGVRSLQTSLMIGLLFGELKRLSVNRRIILLGGAIAIALLANFCRALFLLYVAATQGMSATDRWHDIAGYAIVAIVFFGTIAIAAMLGRKKGESVRKLESRKAKVENEDPRSEVGGQRSELSSTTQLSSTTKPSYPFLLSNFYFLIPAFLWILAVEIGAEFWYRSNERNLVATTAWTIQWPEDASNFHQIKIDQEVRRTLRFDEGQAASWNWPDNSSDASNALPHKRITCSLFFFHWKPGRNSALLANLHRPDVCLPAVGWQQIADTGVKNYPVATALTLPFRHFEFRHGTEKEPAQQVAHAFYCLWEDRAPASRLTASQLPQITTSPSAWTREERLRAVLEGRRHLGQQVMEFVIQSRGPINFDQADARFAQALPQLIEIRDQKSDDGSRKKDKRSTD